MARTRIVVIGYRKFSELINAILPEYSEDASFTLVDSVVSTGIDYQSLVAQYQPDVVVSAGANAAYLQSTLQLPVVSQQVTDIDIIDAVSRARRVGQRVCLFTYQGMGENTRLTDALTALTTGELRYETYSTTDEVREKMLAAIAEGQCDVVVGASYVCDLAEKRGVASMLLYSKESARIMLDEAVRVGTERAKSSQKLQQERPAQLVIQSPQMEQVAELARTYARGSAAVLLQGESGTGKEHIAREIHRLSDYSAGELVAVNCASIPNDLFESELFGYASGAFTSARRSGRVGLLEQADGGVLFLDEIGEMPISQQVKLLRVLQERKFRPVGGNREIPVDFKVVAATNANLTDAVQVGEFRDDLYYRLNVFSLRLPPLRERPEDIEVIAAYYLKHYASEYDASLNIEALLKELSGPLEEYQWPGNVRELQNFTERLVVNSLASNHLNEPLLRKILPELYLRDCQNPAGLKAREERAIREAMIRHNGDRAAVVRELGISTTTLWRRLKKMEFQSDLDTNVG